MIQSRAIQIFAASMLIILGWVTYVSAHCEVPCGIYDDKLRLDLIREHAKTIEKSMKMIAELSSEETKNYNQIVRWVNNKETHASEIQHIVSQYFMTQRIKAPKDYSDDKATAAYNHKLAFLHKMLIHAMKAKQTTDASHCEKLRKLVDKFSEAYFGPMEKEHMKKEHKEKNHKESEHHD